MSEHTSDGTGRKYISHPNTSTLHKGDRESGAACGTQSESWATVEAKNPLDAVVTYATPPCTRCFRFTGRLATIYKHHHSATVVHQDIDNVVDGLPWSLQPGTDGGQTDE
jgi:hypothetical protein